MKLIKAIFGHFNSNQLRGDVDIGEHGRWWPAHRVISACEFGLSAKKLAFCWRAESEDERLARTGSSRQAIGNNCAEFRTLNYFLVES